MPSITVQVYFPPSSAIAEDQVMNTWAFTGTDSAGDLATEAKTRLDQFYSSTPTGGDRAVVDYMATQFDFASTYVKIYDLADPEPRSPIDQDLLGITEPTTTPGGNYPSEVALVLSFHAQFVSGQPPARRRGRIFIGPLNFLAGPATFTGASRPDETFLDDVRLAASRLAGLNDAACSWGVYSRADAVVRPVVGGWVDNAWDTQRRRGEDATARFTWSPV